MSKAGGRVRHKAQEAPSSNATTKGMPQQAQSGPSRNWIMLQQGAQKPLLPLGSRQAMQTGGNTRSRRLLFHSMPMTLL